MANTYTQIYLHYVVATKYRMRFLNKEIEKELYSYASGLTRDLKCFMQCIGGMDDHLHILVGLHPTLAISEFAQKFKANTSRFINEKGWALGKFQWQEGYAAFSVSQSGLDKVREYILHQAEHHLRISFSSEYTELLLKNQIDFNEQFLFHPTLEP